MPNPSVKLTEREFNAFVAEAGLTVSQRNQIGRALARRDGIAVYLYDGESDSPRRKVVSYGGRWAEIKSAYPPDRMPNIGVIGWQKYRLECWYRP